MIVGIGGVSRAGKGTLSALLNDFYKSKGFRVKILHQDQYIQQKKNIPNIQDRVDWEIPESLDFDTFHDEILDAKKKFDLVLAEGLMCFYDKRIRLLFNKKIFVEISRTTFRRRKRNDLRWGKEVEPTWYIDHIWTSFLKYGWPELDDSYLRVSGEYFFDVENIVEWLNCQEASGL